ncbi:MAG: selenocysteine-specific translation elongation factor [Thermodesulfobacteriota bacterium]|nr:selenocysteine-specific translation elongation factor [Thermodesulfobacteriota bacterium]
MKHIILGTAGHIDHGKTSLIKLLTGVNTDRLKEEKLRGITIELGFAPLTLSNGLRIGIVDVPGHEKFVKNMVAGVGGIDIVLLTIATDEGVMPQTREHLEICNLLKIKNGLIALTKIDLVDEEWLELVKEDVEDFIKGTFLEGSPIIPVSSVSGEGVPLLLDTLQDLSEKVEERSSEGLLRLPVDRVFTMKGFGTVITGTLSSGSLSLGQQVEILPSRIETKVRGIQVHNESVEKATAGLRTALNLQGIDKFSIKRGEVLTSPGTISSTSLIDIFFEHLPSSPKPIKNRTRVRFHTGTSEILASIVFFDRDTLPPGESAFARLKMESPAVTMYKDRFIIRSYSPIYTIGGGEVLDSHPTKRKKYFKEILPDLEVFQNGSNEEIIKTHVYNSRFKGLGLRELQMAVSISPAMLVSALQNLMNKREVVQFEKDSMRVIHANIFEDLKGILLDKISHYHAEHPMKEGISKEELKTKLPQGVDAKLFNQTIIQLTKSGHINAENKIIQRAGYSASLNESQEDIQKKIIEIYSKEQLSPPTFKDLVERLSADNSEVKSILEMLVEKGTLVKIKEEFFFHSDAIAKLKEDLVAFLRENKEVTISQFKDITQSSRKYSTPLIEYFDKIRVTIRVGDKRILRESGLKEE